jgi:hypothetical protein
MVKKPASTRTDTAQPKPLPKKAKPLPLKYEIGFIVTETPPGLHTWFRTEWAVGTNSSIVCKQKLNGKYSAEETPDLRVQIKRLLVNGRQINDLSAYRINIRYEEDHALFDLV